MFEFLASAPSWLQFYLKVCFVVGFLVVPTIIGIVARPMLRGLSYGLYEMVLLIKIGAPAKYVLKALWHALWKHPWARMVSHDFTSSSNGYSSWSGIFQWSYSKELNRGLYKKWQAEKPAMEAARQRAMDDDV